MSDLTASLTAPQIRRRANDYDAQIRQGLDDGNVRQVVKRLGKDLTELLTLRMNGTQEQRAAFPKRLFLYVFVRGWNKNKNDPNFLDAQLAILKKFDEDQQSPPPLPASTSTPLPTVPAPQALSRRHTQKAKIATPPPAARVIAPPPSRPLPTARPTRAATPPPTRHGKAPQTRSPSITPPPAHLTRTPTPPNRHSRPSHRRSPPPSPPPAPGPSRSHKVVVEIPHHSPLVKFQDINDDDDEFIPESPPPPPPRRHREPEPTVVQLEVFKIACEKCQRGDRDCVSVVGNGNACRACKEKKYKCSHRGKTDLQTMVVTRPVTWSGSEVMVVEDTKGKKRKADSPVPARERKPKGEVVKVKVEKVEKPKPRQTKAKVEKPREQRGKTIRPNPQARRRALPKSSDMVVDGSGEESEEVEDEDEDEDEVEVIEEPKPKRPRTRARTKPEHEKRLAALEERVERLDKVAEVTTRTSLRMDAMEGNVARFTGALESFLGRIHIDDRLRLVPDHMRISPLPPLPTTRSASPATPMDLPMNEDEDTGPDLSSVAGTRTTPSDHQVERMEAPIASRSGSVAFPDPTPLAAPLPASPLPSPIAGPTVTLIPATPQGTQQVEIPGSIPTPAAVPPSSVPPPSVPSPPTAMNEDPLPLPPPPPNRSQTPAAALLEVDSQTTRARTRSKTPI